MRKFYTTSVDLTPHDKLLTISTCYYDFKNARLVVVARMQWDNETDTPDASHAQVNPAPKYSQVWYSANKLTNPNAADFHCKPE